MSDAQPPDPVVFYTDSCLGKKCADALRAAGFRVERHLDHFMQDSPDVEWLPIVAQNGWVILTKDKAMKPRTSEFDSVLASGAKMFVFGRAQYTGQAMINILFDHLAKIVVHAVNNSGPFIVSMSNSGLRVVHPKSAAKPNDDSGSDLRQRPNRAIESD